MDRRNLLEMAVAGGATLPLLNASTLFAAEPEDPYLRYIHPELRNVYAQLKKMFGQRPPPSLATLAAERQAMDRFYRPWRQDVPVDRKVIPVGKGHPDVTIFIVNPKPGEPRPAILHTHGGGFVTGSAQGGVPELQDLCAELGCTAVSVEYRLAPETNYAGSIEDNYAGLKWLHDNAASIGADPARIALLGESAGGGHAAILAQVARDRGEVPLVFQCLVYPMLDDHTGAMGPRARKLAPHLGAFGWTREANRFGWHSFLGVEPGGRTAARFAVPARTTDLAGLPPAWIGVGGIDLFLDEDIEYAQRLNDAGVAAELIVVPGAFHGFDMAAGFDPTVRISGWFNTAKKNALRRALGLPVS